MGDAYKKQGYAGLAAEQYAKADAWKNQMTGIKTAEKPGADIAAAISNAAVFQSILAALQSIDSGVDGISFSNK